MKKNAGLWIDHRRAFIVMRTDNVENVMVVLSDAENTLIRGRIKAPNETHMAGADDKQKRDYEMHLENFYKNIMESLDAAQSVFIMGPGPAKGELIKAMNKEKFRMKVESVEAKDKMTDAQIVAKIREYFTGEKPARWQKGGKNK